MFYNETAETGVFESQDVPPLPENSLYYACIIEAKHKSDDTQEVHGYISIKWQILEGEYKGRKLSQKLRVRSTEPDKNARANKIMMAIDFNCGGILSKIGSYPTDYQFNDALKNKPMKIVLGIWEQGDSKGNWIKSIYGPHDEPTKKETKEDEPF